MTRVSPTRPFGVVHFPEHQREVHVTAQTNALGFNMNVPLVLRNKWSFEYALNPSQNETGSFF